MDDTHFLKHAEEKNWHAACSCPKCLFNFYKSRNRKTRLTWNSFFLHLLYKKYKSPGDSLGDVVKAYVKLTSDQIKLIGYADRCDIFKVISRVGKKLNLSELESNKFWSDEDDPYVQFKSFVPGKEYSFSERRLLVEFSGDVATYLERENRAGRKTVKHRDVLRRFKKMRAADILPVLDFMEAAKIISWNRELKEISLRPAKSWLGFHLKMIKLWRDEKIDSLGLPLE
jgi:hypothetical protein